MLGTRRMALVAIVAIMGVACGGEADPGPPGAAGEQVNEEPAAEEEIPCEPTKTQIGLLAFAAEAGQAPSFDKGCIAVPEGEPFTVTLDNEDFLEHNFAVFADEAATELLYRGDRFRGPNESMEYEVPAIEPAGTYVFLCDVHRTLMRGTLLVR